LLKQAGIKVHTWWLANLGSSKPVIHYLAAQRMAQFMQVLEVKKGRQKLWT